MNHPEPFHPEAQFLALRAFTLNGVNLKPGDAIDKDGVAPVRLKRMFEGRMIQVGMHPATAAAKHGKARAQKPVEQEISKTEGSAAPSVPAIAVEPASPAQEAQTASAGGVQAIHRGFGRWFVVDAAGKDIAGPISKADATEKAKAAQ